MAGNKNSGRRPTAIDLKTSELARESLTEYYGSLKDAMLAALEDKDTIMRKFVYEHAFGKPTDKIQLDVDGNLPTIQIIQIPDNGRTRSTTEPPGEQL